MSDSGAVITRDAIGTSISLHKRGGSRLDAVLLPDRSAVALSKESNRYFTSCANTAEHEGKTLSVVHSCSEWIVTDRWLATPTPGVVKVAREWHYTGRQPCQVKLCLRLLVTYSYPRCDFYTLPGRSWDGNRYGEVVHTMGCHLREDRLAIPAGATIEIRDLVVGCWCQPQQAEDEPLASVCLERDEEIAAYAFQYMVPHRDDPAYTGRMELGDADDPFLQVTHGFRLQKEFYIYAGQRKYVRHHGYQQVLRAAWTVLSEQRRPRPAVSNRQHLHIKLDVLARALAPGGYGIKEIAGSDGRVYRIYNPNFSYIKSAGGEWQPTFSARLAVGFGWHAWTGLLGFELVRYKDEKYKNLAQLGIDGIDFLIDCGRSPAGMQYPSCDSGFMNCWGKPVWGTYADRGRPSGAAVDIGRMAEGLHWVLYAYEELRRRGIEKRTWLERSLETARVMTRTWPDGNIPARVHGASLSTILPPPHQGGSSSGIYVLAFLARLFAVTNQVAYLDYGRKVGETYLAWARRYEAWWNGEQDDQGLDKTAGHAALRSFLEFHLATAEDRWLEAAVNAARYLAAWQMHYDVVFPGASPLHHFDYRTGGGMLISVGLNALQFAYSPLAYDWILLYRLTGDTYWLERAQALNLAANQFLWDERTLAWLSKHYFANTPQQFHVGYQTEDIYMTNFGNRALGLSKGDIQQKYYVSTPAFAVKAIIHLNSLLQDFGSFLIDMRWHNGGATDSVAARHLAVENGRITCRLANLLPHPESYVVKVFNWPTAKAHLACAGYSQLISTKQDSTLDFTISMEANGSVEFQLTIA